MWKKFALTALVLILAGLLAGCGGDSTPALSSPGPVETVPVGPVPSDTAAATVPPTATAVPMAALVNGEAITQAEFQAQVDLAKAAGTNLATEETAALEQRVLSGLVDELLLAQAARQGGYTLDAAALQQRIDMLTEQAGGQQALDAWMAKNGFSLEGFRAAVQRAAEAAWMRDQIAAGVPAAAEQVHARQILLYNQLEAEQVLAQLQNGADFETIAFGYHPVTGGDLGWFPRGYLLQPAVEAAVFALEAGQYTPIIQTEIGFHIVQVIERDPQHPLVPGARLALQTLAVEDWLNQRRNESDVQIFAPEP